MSFIRSDMGEFQYGKPGTENVCCIMDYNIDTLIYFSSLYICVCVFVYACVREEIPSSYIVYFFARPISDCKNIDAKSSLNEKTSWEKKPSEIFFPLTFTNLY